jgi:hypothetical protein
MNEDEMLVIGGPGKHDATLRGWYLLGPLGERSLRPMVAWGRLHDGRLFVDGGLIGPEIRARLERAIREGTACSAHGG